MINIKYFEEFEVGDTFEYGGYTVTTDDIIKFAQAYDPQTFHVDPEAAKKGPFGSLIASGWHTSALAMRMMVDGLLEGTETMGSPGIDEIRWLRPVKPGDTLYVCAEITDKIPSKSKLDRGLIKIHQSVHNQNEQVVMTLLSMAFFSRRMG